MRLILLVFIVSFSLSYTSVAQQERKLPEGEYCQPNMPNDMKAHLCDCKRMCSNDPGNPSVIIEDRKCKSYCTPSQCHCEVHGCP